MKYLLDTVVILIFLLCVFIGRKRGFIKTVAGIVAFLAALAVSMLLSGPVAGLVYDKAVEPSIVETVDTKLEETKGTAIEQLDNAYQSLPNMVKNLLAQAGVTDVNGLSDRLPTDGAETIGHSVNAVVEPLLLPLIKALCSLVLFFVAYIAASIVLRVLNIIAKLPLLKQLNKTLGLVGGIVSGALWALLAVTVIQVIAATGSADSTITLQTVSETVVVNWVAGINPLGGALSEVFNTAIIK